MADIYCDYANGNDTTGAGTTGNPWKTLQKSINVATGGDTINIANTAPQILSAVINFTTGFTAVASSVTKFKAWDNGGSIVINAPNGSVIAADIDGNGIANIFNNTGTNFSAVGLAHEGMIYHNTSGTTINSTGNAVGAVFYNCEFYNPGSANLFGSVQGSTMFFNCIIRDCQTASGTIGGNLWDGCLIKNVSTRFCVGAKARNCIFINVKEVIPVFTGSGCEFFNNTFISNGAAGDVVFTMTGVNPNAIYNNVFVGYNGAGAAPATFTAGASVKVLGPNLFYNCNPITGSAYIKDLDLTMYDIVTTSDPFVDSASGNYTLKPGNYGRFSAFPFQIPGTSTLTYPDLGGVQAGPTTTVVVTAG